MLAAAGVGFRIVPADSTDRCANVITDSRGAHGSFSSQVTPVGFAAVSSFILSNGASADSTSAQCCRVHIRSATSLQSSFVIRENDPAGIPSKRPHRPRPPSPPHRAEGGTGLRPVGNFASDGVGNGAQRLLKPCSKLVNIIRRWRRHAKTGERRPGPNGIPFRHRASPLTPQPPPTSKGRIALGSIGRARHNAHNKPTFNGRAAWACPGCTRHYEDGWATELEPSAIGPQLRHHFPPALWDGCNKPTRIKSYRCESQWAVGSSDHGCKKRDAAESRPPMSSRTGA